MSLLKRRLLPFAGLLAVVAVPGARAQELRVDASSRFRWDHDAEGGDYDSTFYSNISLTDLIKDHFDLKLAGWGLWDIDANDDFDDPSLYRNVRVSEGYADIRNIGPVSRLRIGRQRMTDVDYLHYDGASIRLWEDRDLSFFAFGGRQVYYYESTKDDYVAGGGLVWKPTRRQEHQLDSYVLKESDNHFLLSAWRWNQYWGNNIRTNSRTRFINNRIRDWRLHGSKFFERWGLGIDLDYYIQPETRAQDSRELQARSLAAFGRVLGVRSANHRLSGSVYKTFGENWMIEAGATARETLDEGRDNGFNSVESHSVRGSITRFNLLIDNLSLTAGGEYIANELDRYYMLTGELNYRPTRVWEFSLGASASRYEYSRIEYEYFIGGTQDVDLLIDDLEIPAYFFEARWRPSRKFDMAAEVIYEDTNDIAGSSWTVRLGMNYHLRHSWTRKEEP